MMVVNMFTYKCLKVVLKKRIDKTSESCAVQKIDVPITTFGHYDCMNFEIVNNWHEFRPIHSNKVGDKLVSEYTVRMVYPYEKITDLREKYSAIDYNVWEAIANSKNNKQRKNFSDIPFVACCLVNLADTFFLFKKEHEHFIWSEYVDYISDKISRKVNEKLNENDGYKLKYAIYFGLGYTDLVILFNSNSLNLIADCINEIRDITYDDNFALISTTYTISGVIQCSKYILQEEKVGVSFDFSKMPDKSLDELKLDISNSNLNNNINLYSIFGSTEWRAVVFDKAIEELAELYSLNTGNGKLVNGDSFKNLFTRLQFKKKLDELEGAVKVIQPNNEKWNYLIDQLDKTFEEFDENYNILFKNKYIHRRTRNALWQIKLMFDKVIATTHGYEVGVLVGRFFINYLNNLNLFIYIINGQQRKYKNKISKLEGIDLEKYKKYIDFVDETNNNLNLKRLDEVISKSYKYKLTKFIEEEVELFRNKISFLLFDIWRSDQPFFEGQTIAHPSVGSTAKLLFAYNYMISEWDRLGREHKNIGSSTKYSFLVTSGGGDETICEKMFSQLSYVRSSRNRPAIITIPEASLYDIKGSLIRLAHEYFHLRGKRLRKERAKYYFQDLCDIVAESIAANANTWFVAEYQSEYEIKNEKLLDNITKDSILQNLNFILKDEIQRLRIQIKEKLVSYFSKMELTNNEADEIYYSDKIYNECFEFLKNSLTRQDTITELANLILKEYIFKNYSSVRKIFDTYADNVAFIEADFVFDGSNSSALLKTITISRLGILNKIIYKFFSKDGEVINRYQIKNQEEAYEELLVYQECYPDCLAIQSIGAEFHEYVFALLFENRNIYDFFEAVIQDNEIIGVGRFITWRFGIVRDMCFKGKEIAISEEQASDFYDVLYPDLKDKKGNKINKDKFVKDLVMAMKVVNKRYNEMTSNELETYPKNLRDYLKKCIERNSSFCNTIKDSIYGKNIALSGNDNLKLYSLLMEKWLNIYET